MFGKLAIALLVCIGAGSVAAQDVVVTYRGSNLMDTLDRADASVMSSAVLTLAGEVIIGTNGLALDPTTGTIYAVIRTAGGDRVLCTVDRGTGVCTDIGVFTDFVASIAFDSAGTLFAVTGDGANNPEELYTVSLSDASMTFLMALGNGNDGEAIAFNADDGLVYHLSGRSGSEVFESIDPVALTITNITLPDPLRDEYTALAYDGAGVFWGTNIDGEVLTLTAAGVETLVGTPAVTDYPKGIIFIPSLGAVVTPPLDLGTTTEGVPGAPADFDVFGTHLLGDVTVTAPADVEVSITSTTGFGGSVVLSPTGGTLANTTVFVRIKASAAVGPITGDITISSPGADDLLISVTGTMNPGEPEMDVTRGTAAIPDGGTDNIGNTTKGKSRSLTYTIRNTGFADLTLTTPVTVGGETNCTVTVSTEPAISVVPSGTTTLVVSVKPAAKGAFSFTVSIDNSDGDENPYNWTVSGTGTSESGDKDDEKCTTGGATGMSLLALLAAISAVAVGLRIRRARG